MTTSFWVGLTAACIVCAARVWVKKPASRDELTSLSMLMALAFIDSAYLATVIPHFGLLMDRFLFHLMLYLTLVSLTLVTYAALRPGKHEHLMIGTATIPWILMLALLAVMTAIGAKTPYLF